MEQSIIFLELVGTVAFAISGAITALGADLDLFGVIALGVVTATGGGVFRDIVLGSFPPEAFVNPMYVAVAAATSLIVFLVVYIGVHTKSEKDAKTLKRLLLIMDSAGLAMFTVMGVNTAFHTAPDNAFLCVFAGVLTGVGGGLVRHIHPSYLCNCQHHRRHDLYLAYAGRHEDTSYLGRGSCDSDHPSAVCPLPLETAESIR